jgi:hypothetical protein
MGRVGEQAAGLDAGNGPVVIAPENTSVNCERAVGSYALEIVHVDASCVDGEVVP